MKITLPHWLHIQINKYLDIESDCIVSGPLAGADQEIRAP